MGSPHDAALRPAGSYPALATAAGTVATAMRDLGDGEDPEVREQRRLRLLRLTLLFSSIVLAELFTLARLGVDLFVRDPRPPRSVLVYQLVLLTLNTALGVFVLAQIARHRRR